MSEYSWPEGSYVPREEAVAAVWARTVEAVPLGTWISGEVIGRQPFGVFTTIDGVPGAIGLAEITGTPFGSTLPELGARVEGEVMGHAEHNHQVSSASGQGRRPPMRQASAASSNVGEVSRPNEIRVPRTYF
jgi:hypothetical protein